MNLKKIGVSLMQSLMLLCLCLSGIQVLAAPSGKLVILNWFGGSDLETIQELEEAFMAKYPDVTVTEIPVTGTSDARGSIRTVLLSGEKADLVINTWPAFRQELVDAGLARSLDDSWGANNWGDALNKSWRLLGSSNGISYGIPYTYGGRSGLWYRTDVFAKAGISHPPKNWDEMLSSFAKLKANGIVPLGIPAKVWAHGEIFETLYVRINGTEMAAKLTEHEIPWTDDSVKKTLRKWRELLEAGCCAEVNVMLGTEWDNAADNTLKNGTTGYFLIGMWVNSRAKNDYKLTPQVDYGVFQFPALGLGHDDTSIVDAKEFLALSAGENPEAADAFLSFVMSAEGANIIAKSGLISTSNNVDKSLSESLVQDVIQVVSKAQVLFVMGDLMPGDVVDEYRVQLQKFLLDPSDKNIDKVTAAIEAKAKKVY